jgi:hypothetical protein
MPYTAPWMCPRTGVLLDGWAVALGWAGSRAVSGASIWRIREWNSPRLLTLAKARALKIRLAVVLMSFMAGSILVVWMNFNMHDACQTIKFMFLNKYYLFCSVEPGFVVLH